MKSTHKSLHLLIYASMALLLGVVNYFLFRPEIVFFKWLGIEATKSIAINQNVLVYFFKNYFSDIAWCISLCFVAFDLAELKYIKSSGKIFLLLIPFVTEGLQYASLINGTFDWYDVLTYFIVITFLFHFFHPLKLMFMKRDNQLFPLLVVALVFFLMAVASTSSRRVAEPDIKYNGSFKLNAEKDEAVKNLNKLQYLKNAANPTIVLRVPYATREVLEEDKNMKTQKNTDGTNNLNDINVYNVIEKELLKGGFTVRDRALFEKVLGDKSVGDYSRIKELTETDLILELSSIQYVRHPMNSFTYFVNTKKKGTIENTINCTNNFNLYGLRLEFRLIKVKENDFIGSFTYNYTPCENGPCSYFINVSSDNSCSGPFLEQGKIIISETRLIPQAEIERFVKASAQKLVSEIFVNK